MTSSPRARSASATDEPMNPAPPVTNTFLCLVCGWMINSSYLDDEDDDSVDEHIDIIESLNDESSSEIDVTDGGVATGVMLLSIC